MTDRRNTPADGEHSPRLERASTSTGSRNAGDGVHHVRLVESPVETSAPDRRHDFVPAPTPRAIVLRPTTNTQFIVTSAIDLRDDVVRDEVPGIVGDACHGILGAERDAIVQAIEQDDTRPIRRIATGTTPPSMPTALLRSAAERADVAAVRATLDHAEGTSVESDALTMTLARGSSPSLDRSVAIARGSSPSLESPVVARTRGMSADECVAAARMTMSRDTKRGGS